MKTIKNKPRIVDRCKDTIKYDDLLTYNKNMDKIQKALEKHLDNKRIIFPRFYFLSNDELLQIISLGNSIPKVSKHVNKCFDNIYELHGYEGIESFASAEGEVVELKQVIRPQNGVETWLDKLEKEMKKKV